MARGYVNRIKITNLGKITDHEYIDPNFFSGTCQYCGQHYHDER